VMQIVSSTVQVNFQLSSMLQQKILEVNGTIEFKKSKIELRIHGTGRRLKMRAERECR